MSSQRSAVRIQQSVFSSQQSAFNSQCSAKEAPHLAAVSDRGQRSESTLLHKAVAAPQQNEQLIAELLGVEADDVAVEFIGKVDDR